MHILKLAGLAALAAILALAGAVWIAAARTEADIEAHEARVAGLGMASPAPSVPEDADLAGLPDPVRRYLAFAFRGPVPAHGVVRLSAEGAFRRPLTEGFAPTTAEQVIAVGTPALMFSATTPMAPGVWARAYDAYAEGGMEMKAKVLSALTVVDERGSPDLDRASLRRWLLEAPLYPQALLPGGPVTWEAIDDTTARAVARAHGVEASMVAHFAEDGRLLRMVAEADGDLATPYHGSGEHVVRDDYRAVGNQMIPMRFTISRMGGGEVLPFWDGRVTAIAFE